VSCLPDGSSDTPLSSRPPDGLPFQPGICPLRLLHLGLRAASKDAHHRRLWGLPPGTSFGVLDPWVNPYYKEPLRIRHMTAEEKSVIKERGWSHTHV
jgi:hypothetical protein